jgi:hypothetical protein
MTYQSDITLSPELLEQIVANGFAYLPELIREMINSACDSSASNISEQRLTNARQSGKIRPLATNPKQSRPEWEKSPLMYPKCTMVVSRLCRLSISA